MLCAPFRGNPLRDSVDGFVDVSASSAVFQPFYSDSGDVENVISFKLHR